MGREGEQGRRRRRHRRHGRHHGRKERILHTRISEQLAEDIRAIAEDLRVPVSNLVRNVLEEAFSAAERVTDDVGDLVDEVMGEAERASRRFHEYRERGGEREEAFRERMEKASEQVGRAAERFSEVVERMAQRSRERAAERAADPAWDAARREADEAEREADVRAAGSATPAPPEAGTGPHDEEAPARTARQVEFPNVVAWQPVVLNTAQVCQATGEALEPGTQAYMGIGPDGFTGVYVQESALPVDAS